jgi:hypothetical protein
MERGVDFLRTQVANGVLAHRAFLKSIEEHESQAKDDRYRDLCLRFLPKAIEHQRMLEDYQQALGAGDGLAKKAVGLAIGAVRDLADVVQTDDFTRLIGDLVMGRQLEDMFKTFREAGRGLGLQQLARIGEVGERDHDEFVKDANRLVQHIFVERVQGSESSIRDAEQPMPGASNR